MHSHGLGTLIIAGTLAGFALAGASPNTPTAAPFRFRPIAPERTVTGSIVGPGAPAERAREPVTVDFPTRESGYLGLYGGRLLASDDGGRNWRTVSSGVRFDALAFVSPRVGFGLSGRLLFRTVDGGRRWERFHAFSRARGYFGPAGEVLSFVDEAHGWAVPADARLYRTSDGGRSWARLGFACGPGIWVVGGVSFVTSRIGFAVCGGQPATIMQARSYYRTDDGGDTWRLTEQRIFSGYVNRLEYVSERVGFESSDRGGIDRLPGHKTLLFTDDGETVWSMSWPDAQHGFALLSHTGLMRTDDDGHHWRRLYPRSLPPPAGPLSFSSTAAGIGAVLSLGFYTRPGAILATQNGGATWTLRASLGHSEIAALARVSRTVVWAVSSDRQSRLVLQRSGDDGRHWQRVRSFPPGGEAWLSFPSKRAGFLGDDRGHLYRTKDGGRTWYAVRYPEGVERGVFLSASEGLAITEDTLLATTDGGLSWESVPIRGLSIAFRALGALDRRDIWVGGLDLTSSCSSAPCRGLLLHSSDGGRRWTLIRLPTAIGVGGFDWVTPLVGYSVGPFRTRDAGRTWQFLPG